MQEVWIDDLPEDAYAVLRRRAAVARQSLQEYLRSKLIEEASRPALPEVFDRIERERFGGSVPLVEAVALVREDRGCPGSASCVWRS